MRAERDTTRIVRSSLEEGVTALREHVLDNLLPAPDPGQRAQPYGLSINLPDPNPAQGEGGLGGFYVVDGVASGPLVVSYYTETENPEFMAAMEELLAGLEFNSP